MIYTVTLNPAIDYVVRVADFKEDHLNVATQEQKFPGGKGINVSRVLKKLGCESVNYGFIGGFTGDFIKNQLKKEGLKTQFNEVTGDTRINIKLKSITETEINGQGPDISSEHLAELKKKFEQLTSSDLVIFSGSLPKGVPDDLYIKLAKQLSEAGIPFIVDISNKQLLDIATYQPVLVKPNQHELAAIFDTTFKKIEDMIPYGNKLLELGAQNVLLSMGADGAALFTKEGIYRAKGLKGELKNSVGAGDSMVAGFTSQLVKGEDIKTCFRYGVASGSATAFSDDLGQKELILSLMEKVDIKKI